MQGGIFVAGNIPAVLLFAEQIIPPLFHRIPQPMPAPTPRRSDRITPGYYRFRKVKRGPFVAARISVRDGVIYVAEEDQPAHFAISETDFAAMVTAAIMDGEAFTHPLLRIAWYGQPIDEIEYRHLIAYAKWARLHAPQHPAARPTEPVDLNTLPIDLIF